MPGLRAVEWPLAAYSALAVAGLSLWAGFSNGGYFAGATAWIACSAIVLLVVVVAVSRVPWPGRAAGIALACLCLFVGWTLLSSNWSHATGRALLEANRSIAYVAVFAVFACVPADERSLRWVLRMAFVSLAIIALAGLLARLHPSIIDVPMTATPSRLSWPLGYWNAMGLAAAVAVVLALGLLATSTRRGLPQLAVAAAVPLLTAVIYLTLSRGAAIALAVGLTAIVVLQRGAVVPLLAVAAPAALAVLACTHADALTGHDPQSAIGHSQGDRLTVLLAVCAVLSVALVALGELTVRRWRRRRPGPAATPSGRKWSIGVLTGVVAVVIVAIAVTGAGSRAVREFAQSENPGSPGSSPSRLLDVASNGRADLWQVSLDAFQAHPLRGTGAGTFASEWARERPYRATTQDGHSLYLETLGELGIVGLVLILVPLGLAVARLLIHRRRLGASAAVAAAFLVAWLMHAALDWDWEMPAVAMWVFALAGAACARARVDATASSGRRQLVVRGAAAIALLALGLLIPVRVGASQHELDKAITAYLAGRFDASIDASLAASRWLPARAEPFQLLAYSDAKLGRYDLAERQIAAARRRDPSNWELVYSNALIRGASGRDFARLLADAARLNPLEVESTTHRLVAAKSGRERTELARSQPLPLTTGAGLVLRPR